MENRIEINGVWYVREDAITDPLDHLEAEEMDLTFSEECCFESNKYCFVASRTKKITVKNFTKTLMLNSQIKEVVIKILGKKIIGTIFYGLKEY